jgi:hypothetical protein
MLSLSALLCEPNPDDPLVREIAMQWKKNRQEHDRIAAQWTKEYVLDCLAFPYRWSLTLFTIGKRQIENISHGVNGSRMALTSHSGPHPQAAHQLPPPLHLLVQHTHFRLPRHQADRYPVPAASHPQLEKPAAGLAAVHQPTRS